MTAISTLVPGDASRASSVARALIPFPTPARVFP